MGDPIRTRNKYFTPMHPWEKERLETEKKLMKEYGLVNKKEIWKVNSKLKKFKDNAKSLVAKTGDQAQLERKQLADKLKSYGLIESDSLDEILGLGLEQFLERRLQTVLVRKGFARSVKQARQMITHKHVTVNGKMISSPGYLVTVKEENSVKFYPGSAFTDEMHPERKLPEKITEKPAEKEVIKADVKSGEEAKAQ